jgi:hypothetical protein
MLQNLQILKTIWLNDLTDLEFIEEFAFNCTSCLKLSISNNKIQFHRIDRYNPNFILVCVNSSFVGINSMADLLIVMQLDSKPGGLQEG